ncbi:MAG TPA: hypothetical protein VGF28_00100 [Thermoanaerobaculia bacterium]|jgi:hypothetical protein
MKRGTILLVLTFIASSAVAGEVMIPATYRGHGANGALWRTGITVANLSNATPTPVPIAITYHRDGGEPHSIYMPLAQYEVISLPDALHSWFDVEQGGGIVRVTWDDPNARISAQARVYNAGGTGEYGQGMPGVRTDSLRTEYFLPGLSGVNGNRTNVGVSNPHDRHIAAWVTLYDTAGLPRGSYSIGIPPRSFRQINDVFSLFNAGRLDAAMVRVTAFDSTLYAYASVVRDDTGDATYIAGQP